MLESSSGNATRYRSYRTLAINRISEFVTYRLCVTEYIASTLKFKQTLLHLPHRAMLDTTFT